MKRMATKICVVLMLCACPALASGVLEGRWKIEGDRYLDGSIGRIDFSPAPILFHSQGNQFVGEYTQIVNDSIFQGEVFDGRNGVRLIYFVQYDDNGYYNIYSAKEVEPGVFRGTWHSIGDCGDFEMRPYDDEMGPSSSGQR